MRNVGRFMTEEQHEVRITIKEVWAAQQQQGALISKMNANLERFLDSHDRLEGRVTDHEARLRTLEQKVWAASGAAALMGATMGTIINLIMH